MAYASIDLVNPRIGRPVSEMLAQALRGVYKHTHNRSELCGIAVTADPELELLPPLISQSTADVRSHSSKKVEAFTHSYSIVDLGVEFSKEEAGLCDNTFNPTKTDFYHHSVHTTVPTRRCVLEKRTLKLCESLISELIKLNHLNGGDLQSECERIFNEYGSHVHVGDIHFGGVYSREACYSGVGKATSVVCENVDSALCEMRSSKSQPVLVVPNISLSASKKKGGPCSASSFRLWKMGLESNVNSWTLIDRGVDAVGIWEILLNHESEVPNVTHLSQLLFNAWKCKETAMVQNTSSSMKMKDGHEDMPKDCLSDENDSCGLQCATLPTEKLELLTKLRLEKYYPQKISFENVMQFRVLKSDEKTGIEDVPWNILKNLIMLERDGIVNEVDRYAKSNENHRKTENTSSNTGFIDDIMEDSPTCELNPSDIFLATFVCCDLNLRQILVEKMNQCHLAVPFLSPGVDSQDLTYNLWSWRSTILDWCDASQRTFEVSAANCPLKVVSCLRLGRPNISKSQLLNHLINDNSHSTFLHKDSPCGDNERVFAEGLVEASVFLPDGKQQSRQEERLQDVTMFLNLRGDGRHHRKQIDILGQISTVVLACLDASDLRSDEISNEIAIILKTCKSVVIILSKDHQISNSQLTSHLQEFQQKVGDSHQGKIRIVCTFTAKGVKNAATLNSDVGKVIREYISRDDHVKLQGLSPILQEMIHVDEDDKHCQEGRELADKVMSCFSDSTKGKRKSELLPLQGSDWHEWCRLLKEKSRSATLQKAETIEEEMQSHREDQVRLCSKLSPFMQIFIEGLESSLGSPTMEFYIQWLKMHLNDISRQELPALRRQCNERKRDLKSARHEGRTNTQMLEKEVRHIEKDIVNTEIGIEHLMREMGQIYEAIEAGFYVDLRFINLPKLAAILILNGHALEIMDGDAPGVPLIWLHAVFSELEKNLGKQKLFSISVLGIQSSGKSTLLNTMFGFQFPVSAGRCTRGVYMQLMKVKEDSGLPFNYVAILDSKGLRPQELTDSSYDHDNELATFLIGLGNMTVINIKGENVSEVKDILQIVCHAFLRMMMVNEKIQKDRSCVFVHQNVPAVNAREKLKDGAHQFEKNLDDMTAYAARLENLVNVHSFKQVIRFDSQNRQHIWYFPDLWHGDPPMASVNPGYHENVTQLKSSILREQAKKSKWFYSFEGMADFIDDMWNGVLADDFVFGFRSSHMTKAYNQLEDKFAELKWELEVAVIDWLGAVQLEERDTTESLESCCEKLKKEAVAHIMKMKDVTSAELDSFIEDDGQKHILESWQTERNHSLHCLAESLCTRVKKDIDKLRGKYEVSTLKSKERHEHELEILRKAQELAKKVKNEDENLVSHEFEKMWNEWIRNIDQEETNLDTIEETLTSLLQEHLRRQAVVLQPQLVKNPLSRIPSLVGSITKADLTPGDLGITRRELALQNGKTCGIHQNAVSQIDAIFRKVDAYIKQVSVGFKLQNAEEVLKIIQIEIDTSSSHPQSLFQIGKRLEVRLVCHVTKYLLRYRLLPSHLTEDVMALLIQLYPCLQQDELAVELQQCNLEGSYKIHESDISTQQDEAVPVPPNQRLELKKAVILAIDGIFSKVDSYISLHLKKSSGFQDHDARQILKIVQDGLREFNKRSNQKVKIPTNLEVQLFVHVCRYCLPVFLDIQEQYNRKYTIAAQLQDYKNTTWNLFLNVVKQNGKGVTAAGMLCDQLTPLIKKHVKDSVRTAVVKEVVPHFYAKKKLIKAILQDLAEKKSFSAYEGYLHNTEMFVYNWLVQYTNRFIFNERSGSSWYMDKVQLYTEQVIASIESSITQTCLDNITEKTIGSWTARFSRVLLEMAEPLALRSTQPPDINNYEVLDFQNIARPVANRLKVVKEQLLESHRKDTAETVDWGEKSPYTQTYTSLWGCEATCPFCEEPCIKSNPDHASEKDCHECIQHRPRGIMHWRKNDTKQLVIENCNHDVHGKGQFLCSGTDHKCNSKGNLDRKYHSFRSYKKYMPLWDIPPSADMSGSNYWKWFFCQYKKEIAEAAGTKEPDIPKSWYNITDEKAIESLFVYDSVTSQPGGCTQFYFGIDEQLDTS